MAAAHTAPELAGPLADVTHQMHRGRRLSDALGALPDWLGQHATYFTDTLVTADRYGHPLGPVLDQLSADVRADRSRLAQQQARTLPVDSSARRLHAAVVRRCSPSHARTGCRLDDHGHRSVTSDPHRTKREPSCTTSSASSSAASTGAADAGKRPPSTPSCCSRLPWSACLRHRLGHSRRWRRSDQRTVRPGDPIGHRPRVNRSVRDRGQAAVEFAIALPLVVMLVLGVVQIAVIIRDQLSLELAAHEGARATAVAGAPSAAAASAAEAATGLSPIETTTSTTADSVTVTVRHTTRGRMPLLGPLIGDVELDRVGHDGQGAPWSRAVEEPTARHLGTSARIRYSPR